MSYPVEYLNPCFNALCRFACLVCRHRPVFDTVNSLAVHRSGSKHAARKQFDISLSPVVKVTSFFKSSTNNAVKPSAEQKFKINSNLVSKYVPEFVFMVHRNNVPKSHSIGQTNVLLTDTENVPEHEDYAKVLCIIIKNVMIRVTLFRKCCWGNGSRI